MKILAIGDPHGDLEKIKRIPLTGLDLILITGDLGKADLARKIFFGNHKRKEQGLPELKETSKQKKEIYREIHNSTIEVLRYLSKYAPVYTIQGNVGIPSISEVKKLKKEYNLIVPSTKETISKMKNVYLIKNRLKKIEGIRIGFLEYFIDKCWVKEFQPKNKKNMKKAIKETAKASKTLSHFDCIDILVCHQPPYGLLDKVTAKYGAPKHWQGKHAGSKIILNYVKRQQPKYVFCGHIHEGEGERTIGKTKVYNLGVGNYKFINITSYS